MPEENGEKFCTALNLWIPSRCVPWAGSSHIHQDYPPGPHLQPGTTPQPDCYTPGDVDPIPPLDWITLLNKGHGTDRGGVIQCK